MSAPVVDRVYTGAAAAGLVGLLLRAAAAAVCLLPPAMLMGATLPVLPRWAGATPDHGTCTR
ncbi:MAG: hypothetical protein ACRD44_11555 [Bryobacteraceae bacterium]